MWGDHLTRVFLDGLADGLGLGLGVHLGLGTLAEARGESGTALDYLRELIAHLRELRVDEPALAAVLSAAERYRGEA